MEQPIAKVNLDDIERILKRDFKGDEDKALEMLKNYKDNETHRVWSAILKLSNCDIKKVREYVELAKADYRDVLALAEYPKYSLEIGFNTDKYTNDEIDKIIIDDFQQYKLWFSKG